ncbi:MAG: hypothetical protein KBT48_01635 [Firmicutes bacterium]|nr:hypothetical protein [Bacillota bacterium]
MNTLYIILIFLIILVIFGTLFRQVDFFMKKNHKPNKKIVLSVALDHMDFSDMIQGRQGVVYQYQVKPFEQVQKEIQNGSIDFGLFHKYSVKNISNTFYKVSMFTHTDSSDFADEKLLDQNVVLVTNKKNVQKLVELGIIKKRN